MSKNQRDLVCWVRGRLGFQVSFSAQTSKNRSIVCFFPPLIPPDESYRTHGTNPSFPMVGVAGFEPATLRLSSACSNQLSYTPAHC